MNKLMKQLIVVGLSQNEIPILFADFLSGLG
jgi:hypothetical protein